jgi:hypothetical protein
MFQLHHILPKQFADHSVVRFLVHRFNHNGIGNLIALSSDRGLANDLGSSPHTGGHLKTYHCGFGKFLRAVQQSQTFSDAQAGDTAALDRLSVDLNRFVAAAKYALANKHLFANTPVEMTREEANKNNDEWFANWEAYAKRYESEIRQMQNAVDQLYNSGRLDAAAYWPVRSPTSNLSLADKIEILRRYDRNSLSQFTVVGPIPDLPGFVPPVVDSRLPGFIPSSLDGLNRPEGFTRSDPHLTYGLPGFPMPDPSWQRLGKLPPSTAISEDPLILKFDPATGAPLPFSERSPILEPDAPSTGTPPTALYAAAGLAALAATAPALPLELLAPAVAGMLAGTAATKPAFGASAASGSGFPDQGVFSRGVPPYNAFDYGHSSPDTNNGGYHAGLASWPPLIAGGALEREPGHVNAFADRFGNWPEISAGTMPAQTSGVLGPASPGSAGAVAPEDIRRLTRVNSPKLVDAFAMGSAPVPYLPAQEFDDRFGNWIIAPVDRQSLQASRPIGAFAGEPSYAIPPPIFGLPDQSIAAGDSANDWYDRWIKPFVQQ